MIVRLWRGWTTAANADGYEELIRSTIFPHILDRGIDGLFRLDLYRRAGEVETEFALRAPTGRRRSCPPRRALCFHTSRRKRRTMSRGSHRKPRRTSDRTRTNERWPHGDVLLHLANGEDPLKTPTWRAPAPRWRRNSPVGFIRPCGLVRRLALLRRKRSKATNRRAPRRAWS